MTLTEQAPPLPARQVLPAEERFAAELAFLTAHDDGPRPPGWALTPRSVVTFVCGSNGVPLELPRSRRATAGDGAGLPSKLVISAKFVGERALVERCVVTLAGERGLLLVGEPGTAKSMLSELLAGGGLRHQRPDRAGHRRHHRGRSSATAGTTRCCWRRGRSRGAWCRRRC